MLQENLSARQRPTSNSASDPIADPVRHCGVLSGPAMVRCGSSARQGPVLRRARVYSQTSIPKNTIGELDEPRESVLLEILHAKDGTIQATHGRRKASFGLRASLVP